ncbi:hypothetical protein ACFL1M_02600 [Patescibacteria group bacterium]
MSKKTAVLSLGYWFSAITLGMLQHPYKTMREVVRKKSLRMSFLAPIVWISLLWVMSVLSIFLGRVFLSLLSIEIGEVVFLVLEFLFWWGFLFLVLWQILVGYLYFRFRSVINFE